MSDSDESNFGALLFGDEANEAPPEYPVETLMVDRLANLHEGVTNPPYKPMYHCFDSLRVKTVPCAPTNSPAETERLPQVHEDIGEGESIEEQLTRLSARLEALKPQPLAVHYRNKHHSLWGHRLWNAAKYLSKRMDQRCVDVRGRSVLELGAGLGVPSLVAYRNGASVVVVTDYPDADLIDIIRLNVEENCTPAHIDADAARPDAPPPVAVVEPLLWGKREHIRKVMGYTSGVGFDIVILSDILFNHVCNDDLVDTLLQTLSHKPTSAGYCVFSHHRAYKQLQDFEFFDKCVAKGLVYEQVDEQDYPMMFPEDRGPEAVRMPVKCYKITRRYDAVGPPLDLHAIFAAAQRAQQSRNGDSDSQNHPNNNSGGGGGGTEKTLFDAVVLGTGLVQSLVSAALARSGLTVLHCDGEPQYGGAHATLNLGQFRAYLKRMEKTEYVEEEGGAVGGQAHLYRRPQVPGTTRPRTRIDKTTEAAAGASAVRYFIDVLPASYMANGDLIQQLVKSDMARTLELQNLGGFLFLTSPLPEKQRAAATPTGVVPVSVPLTRSDIFATSEVGLLDKRRLMKFVKDVEASLAEQLHAKSASPADSAEMQREAAARAAAEAAAAFAKELEGNRQLTLSELLTGKYGLTGSALDIITLMGQLDVKPHTATTMQQPQPHQQLNKEAADEEAEPGLLHSIQLVRQLLTSVGAYGGATPFLIPAYGASELPQNICRTSAVWGSVFVLARGVCRVYIDEATETQYAVLTNGQHIPTQAIVAPVELTRPVPAAATTTGAAEKHEASTETEKAGVRAKEGAKLPLPVLLAGWKPVLEREQRRAKGLLDEGLTEAELAAMAAEGRDTQLSRVVLIARRPLISAAALRAAVNGGKVGDAAARATANAEQQQQQQHQQDNEDGKEEEEPPVVMGFVRASTTGGAHTESGSDAFPVVHVVQHSAGSEQVAPRTSSHVIVHFTVDARSLSQDALEQFVEERFLNAASAPSGVNAAAHGLGLNKETDVLYFASFTLSATQAALDSIYGDGSGAASPDAPLIVDIPSATRESHAFAIAECEKLQRATENDRRRVLHEHVEEEEEGDADPTDAAKGTGAEAVHSDSRQGTRSPFLRLIGVPTLLPSMLDDGLYVAEARKAYEKVVDLVADKRGLSPEMRREKFIFMEKQPPLPPPSA